MKTLVKDAAQGLRALLKRAGECLTPLRWAQEDFHSGQQLLIVWRWGRRTWERWDWGVNVGSDDVHRELTGLSRRQAYARIRARAQLRLITSDWRIARGMV